MYLPCVLRWCVSITASPRPEQCEHRKTRALCDGVSHVVAGSHRATCAWQTEYPSALADYPDGGFYVPAGSLGFTVTVFTACALCCFLLMLMRRKLLGGELGGARRWLSAAVLVLLWLVFVVLASLKIEDML